jgi:hypothetical protein
MSLTMKKKSSKVFDLLDNYFSKMDAAPVGGDSIFADENAKQRHESILMYAFRKYRAACYHAGNVKRLLGDAVSDADSAGLPNTAQLPEGAEVKISVTRTADHFIYELAAFFEAAKSSLDFIAAASSVYLKGMTTDSIRSFIRCADQNSNRGHVFDVIKRHLVWLKGIREYRHHLVHRMVITASVGDEVHKRGNLVKQVKHPVVVPKLTPSYFPDTRRSRMIQDERSCLDSTRSQTIVQYPDGTKEIVDFSIGYTPSKGYAEISEFMASHLHRLEEFFCDIIREIEKLKFVKYD